MSNRSYDYRKYKRYVKGIKRIKQDRAEHGNDFSCQCFCPDADRGKGAIFARFADTPKYCSCWMCSNKAVDPWPYPKYIPED